MEEGTGGENPDSDAPDPARFGIGGYGSLATAWKDDGHTVRQIAGGILGEFYAANVLSFGGSIFAGKEENSGLIVYGRWKMFHGEKSSLYLISSLGYSQNENSADSQSCGIWCSSNHDKAAEATLEILEPSASLSFRQLFSNRWGFAITPTLYFTHYNALNKRVYLQNISYKGWIYPYTGHVHLLVWLSKANDKPIMLRLGPGILSQPDFGSHLGTRKVYFTLDGGITATF